MVRAKARHPMHPDDIVCRAALNADDQRALHGVFLFSSKVVLPVAPWKSWMAAMAVRTPGPSSLSAFLMPSRTIKAATTAERGVGVGFLVVSLAEFFRKCHGQWVRVLRRESGDVLRALDGLLAGQIQDFGGIPRIRSEELRVNSHLFTCRPNEARDFQKSSI